MLAEIECDEGHEFMLQGNDSVCVAKDPFADVKDMTKEDLDLLCCRRSGSMRQPHRSQEQQTVQGRNGRRKRESWTGRKKGEELRVKEWRERKGKRMRSRRT